MGQQASKSQSSAQRSILSEDEFWQVEQQKTSADEGSGSKPQRMHSKKSTSALAAPVAGGNGASANSGGVSSNSRTPSSRKASRRSVQPSDSPEGDGGEARGTGSGGTSVRGGDTAEQSVQLLAFGLNHDGQLGVAGGATVCPSPVAVSPLDTVSILQVACGSAHSVVLTINGEIFSWGSNSYGQLGRSVNATSPATVPGLVSGGAVKKTLRSAHALAVAAGGEHSAVLTSAGVLLTCGRGDSGQLGHGDTKKRSEFKAVQFPKSVGGSANVVKAVVCGGRHTLVIAEHSSDGNCHYAFGANDQGQLGVPVCARCTSPTPIDALWGLPVVQLAAGYEHSLALTAGGRLLGWGSEEGSGVLGGGPMPRAIVPAAPDAQFVSVVCGERHNVATTKLGDVCVWGAEQRAVVSTFGHKSDLAEAANASARAAAPTDTTFVQRGRPPPGVVVPALSSSSSSSVTASTPQHGQPPPPSPEAAAAPALTQHSASSAAAAQQLLNSGPNEELQNDDSESPHVRVPIRLRLAHVAAVASGEACSSAHATLAAAGGSRTLLQLQRRAGAGEKRRESSRRRSSAASTPLPSAVVVLDPAKTGGGGCAVHIAALDGRLLNAAASGRAHALLAATSTAEMAYLNSQAAAGGGNVLPQRLTSSWVASAVARCEQANAGAERQQLLAALCRRLRECFSSPASLSASFLRCRAPAAAAAAAAASPLVTLGVDMTAVRAAYLKLWQMNEQTVRDALLGGIDEFVRVLVRRRYQLGVPYSESVRCFLIILECPVLLNARAETAAVIAALTAAIVALEPPARGALFSALASYTPEYFLMPVNITNGLMSHVLAKQPRDVAAFRACGSLMAHLNVINNDRRIVPLEAFYNAHANQYANMQYEYWQWRAQRDSVCHYPFLLNANTKTTILHHDAEAQMKAQVESELLRSMQSGHGPTPYLVLSVRRGPRMVEDALQQLTRLTGGDLKKPLKVKMVGEEAIDAGGVTKEFFQLIMAQLFDMQYGMFVEDTDSRFVYFNRNSSEQAGEFQLIGIIIGLAIYNSCILDLHFPHCVYKKLVGEPVTLQDYAELHPVAGRSLQQMLAYDADDFDDVFGDLDFTVTHEYYGANVVTELVPGGAERAVSAANREEYVQRLVDHELNGCVRMQFEAFRGGFEAVCGGPALGLFRPEELELLVCGSSELNMAELRSVTAYKGGFSPTHRTIQNFWNIVLNKMTPEEHRKLLLFVTGSDRVPINGLAALKFVIHCAGPDSSRVMTAATCFNTMYSPAYASASKMERKLRIALENASGFGMK